MLLKNKRETLVDVWLEMFWALPRDLRIMQIQIAL